MSPPNLALLFLMFASIAWFIVHCLIKSPRRIDGMLVPYFVIVAVVVSLFAAAFTWRVLG